MSRQLEKAKEVIKQNINDARYGIFNTCNIFGDPMVSLYDEDGLEINICYYYEYFEVFGLSDEEFEELAKYYESLWIVSIRRRKKMETAEVLRKIKDFCTEQDICRKCPLNNVYCNCTPEAWSNSDIKEMADTIDSYKEEEKDV